MKIKTYVISDLKLFNEEQKDLLGFENFEDMNKYVIYTWNKVVKPDDVVMLMGDIGEGTKEDFQKVFSKLNGKIELINKNFEQQFTRKEWNEIGISGFWRCSVYKDVPEGRIMYLVDEIEELNDFNDFILVVLDSNNSIPNFIYSNMLSVEAIKWGYNPIDTSELLTIYQNMKIYEELDVNEETIIEMEE